MSAAPATIAEALRWPGIESTAARVLLQRVLGLSHAELIARAGTSLDDAQRRRFRELAARCARGEPVAYLLGFREFYGRRFEVGPSVLIPRPETELLVELALARIGICESARVLDLGTGSGNIALTLALERPQCAVTAVDASLQALAVARANGARLNVRNIELLSGDWFAPVAGRSFDLVLSNPPYVAEQDPHLADLRFEPTVALQAGPDGLAAIREIVAQAAPYLRPDGWLLLEHGYDQADACRALLADAGFDEVFSQPDLAGVPRVSGGARR
jgi:release factor glutamine methyltransferase